jgi:hypothetical protein
MHQSNPEIITAVRILLKILLVGSKHKRLPEVENPSALELRGSEQFSYCPVTRLQPAPDGKLQCPQVKSKSW